MRHSLFPLIPHCRQCGYEVEDREVAVRLVVKTLTGAKEGRKEVYRDYKKGKVRVGNELVSKWDDDSQVMSFRGEGKDIGGHTNPRRRDGGGKRMSSASEGGGRASGLPALLPGVRSFWASTRGRN